VGVREPHPILYRRGYGVFGEDERILLIFKKTMIKKFCQTILKWHIKYE
jgi:hypothetical protein